MRVKVLFATLLALVCFQCAECLDVFVRDQQGNFWVKDGYPSGGYSLLDQDVNQVTVNNITILEVYSNSSHNYSLYFNSNDAVVTADSQAGSLMPDQEVYITIEVACMNSVPYAFLGFSQQCGLCLNNCNYPNGYCSETGCVCNSGWVGSSCETMFVIPEFACQLQPFSIQVTVPPDVADSKDWLAIWNVSDGSGDSLLHSWSSSNCYSYMRFWYLSGDPSTDYIISTSMPAPLDLQLTFPYAMDAFFGIFAADLCLKSYGAALLPIYPWYDPHCFVGVPECYSNCSGVGTCMCDDNNNCHCECDAGYFGSACEYGCAGTTYIEAYGGDITDGSGYFRYLPNLNCTWEVYSPSAESIMITFNLVEFGDIFDTITLMWGDNDENLPISATYGGALSVHSYVIPASRFTLAFTSTAFMEGDGFNITFQSLGCPPGKYVNDQYQCVDCPAGTYNDKKDQHSCISCFPGSFSKSEGSVACNLCPIATYQPNNNSASCFLCPNNAKTDILGAQSLEDCTCKNGFYSLGAMRGVECHTCPEGAVCENSQALAVAEYWNSPEDPYVFLKCTSPSACPGYSDQCKIGCCGSGWVGSMCSGCRPGFYQHLGNCHSCDGASSGWLFVYLIAMFILSAILYKTVNREQTLALLSINTTMGLLISFAQVILVYQEELDTWPPFVTTVTNNLSILNFNIGMLSPECALDSSYARYFIKFLFPLLFPIIFMLFHVLLKLQSFLAKTYGHGFQRAYSHWASPGSSRIDGFKWKLYKYCTEPHKLDLNKTINTLLMIYDLLYLYECKMTFEVFNCYKNTDGTSSFHYDPSVRCYSSDWWRYYMPYSILSTMIYVIPFPLLLGRFNYNARTMLKDPSFVSRNNTLFYRFRSNKFYWQSVIIIRKFLIAFVVLAVTSITAIRSTLAFLVVIVALIAHIYHQPYKDTTSNMLETFLLVIFLVIVSISMLFVAESPQDANFNGSEIIFSTFGGFVLVLILLGLLVPALVIVYYLVKIIAANTKVVPVDEYTLYVHKKGDVVPTKLKIAAKSISEIMNKISEVFYLTGPFKIYARESELTEFSPVDNIEDLPHNAQVKLTEL